VIRSLVCLLLCLPAWSWAIDQYTYRVLDKKPLDRSHWVQGLEIHDGMLYMSTGLYGESRLLRFDLATGALQVERRLNPQLFGEGLTLVGDRIYQLTWKRRMLLEFSRDDMKALTWHPIPGLGWGLTNDGTHLIYTDGGDKLHYMDLETKRIVRSVPVTENGKPLPKLNELEWVDGMIWANLWYSDRIVIVDPRSGKVTASVDLSGLLSPEERASRHHVLNGIARDPATGDIWVTGKRWPWVFNIEPIPLTTPTATGNSR
jgi:glutamine cyclotransferase